MFKKTIFTIATLLICFSANADFSDIAEEQAILFLAEDCDTVSTSSNLHVTLKRSVFNEDARQIFYNFELDYEVFLGQQSLGSFYVRGEGQEAMDEFVDWDNDFVCPTESPSNP